MKKKNFILFFVVVLLFAISSTAALADGPGRGYNRGNVYIHHGGGCDPWVPLAIIAGAVVVSSVIEATTKSREEVCTQPTGRCFQTVTVGYIDRYGDFRQTGRKRIQVPCE